MARSMKENSFQTFRCYSDSIERKKHLHEQNCHLQSSRKTFFLRETSSFFDSPTRRAEALHQSDLVDGKPFDSSSGDDSNPFMEERNNQTNSEES